MLRSDIPVQALLHRRNMSAQSKILHCTMKYIGKVTDQSKIVYATYAENRCVAHLIGKMIQGFVIGFTITPRTLGKIRLNL
jgi:hypothetical protein